MADMQIPGSMQTHMGKNEQLNIQYTSDGELVVRSGGGCLNPPLSSGHRAAGLATHYGIGSNCTVEYIYTPPDAGGSSARKIIIGSGLTNILTKIEIEALELGLKVMLAFLRTVNRGEATLPADLQSSLQNVAALIKEAASLLEKDE